MVQQRFVPGGVLPRLRAEPAMFWLLAWRIILQNEDTISHHGARRTQKRADGEVARLRRAQFAACS